MSRVICLRKSDGATFEPSTPDGYTEAEAVADLLCARRTFFFRRVELAKVKRFLRGEKVVWRRTGETWEPSSGEFFVSPTAVEFEGER